MTATVVRIKRRVTEDPSEALFVACKRSKVEAPTVVGTDLVGGVLTFAGTVKDGADLIQIQQTIRNTASLSYKYREGIKRKLSHDVREMNTTDVETRKNIKKYRVVTGKEEPVEDSFKSAKPTNDLQIVDLVIEDANDVPKMDTSAPPVVACNGVPLVREKVELQQGAAQNNNYVYDLYYLPNSEMYLDLLYNNNVFVEPILKGVSFWESDGEASDKENQENEEDDENDENNYRNDYPDRDPDSDGDSLSDMNYHDFLLGVDEEFYRFDLDDCADEYGSEKENAGGPEY